VQQVDPAHDGEHALDGAGELLARGVRVARVEAEANLDVAVLLGDDLPQSAEASKRRATALSPPAVFSM
jgi:hypothetical protein